MTEYQRLQQVTKAARLMHWRTILRDLNKTADAEHTVVRFPNSSSYIFTSSGRHWAVDPVYAVEPCPEDELQEVTRGLHALDFMIITHCHQDHMQRSILLDFVSDSTKRIIIPAAIATMFCKLTAIPPARVTTLALGASLQINDMTITACQGYHGEPGLKPYPSGSFHVALPDGVRLFFPSDVRDYTQPWPAVATAVDYLFGHVWLGRGISENLTFPMLDSFCHFMSYGHPKTLFLAHLGEVSRDAKSMWTPRHAQLITRRMAEMAPAVNVVTPRHGSVAVLTKPARSDLFHGWCPAAQDGFLNHLGVSIRFENWRKPLEQAIAKRVPVLELAGAVPQAEELAALQKRLSVWRAAGGHTLSGHLCDIHPEPERLTAHRANCDALLCLGVDRVTQHVPPLSVKAYDAAPERVVDAFATALQPLILANVSVGVENMHMRAGMPQDERRCFGSIPAESMAFVAALRQQTGYSGIGFHFDIGHASSNYPFTDSFPTSAWLDAGGAVINGVHLHQCDTAPCDAQIYPEGHHHISGRMAGYPSLFPIYDAWQRGVFRAPMFLEIRRGHEADPFISLYRLRQREFG